MRKDTVRSPRPDTVLRWKAVYETRDAVYIHTNLLGPEKGEETKEVTTYPYVVIQMEYIEKDVLFD